MKGPCNSVLLSQQEIQDRVAELGRRISVDYASRSLNIIVILKGSLIFAADLVRRIDPSIPLEIDFISASSYGPATTSSGDVRITDLGIAVEGKDVIIVEDIIDTGLTLARIRETIAEQNAQSIRIAALLEKPEARRYPHVVDYVGFQIPDRFVVGYGMDHAGRYRNLPEIRILEEDCRG